MSLLVITFIQNQKLKVIKSLKLQFYTDITFYGRQKDTSF